MKLKKLEMQAFKSYENLSDGTFDFTENDSISNFVSIYAPNGFGKTTFYDAIDFCLTNNIFRYVREKSLERMNEAQAKSINQAGVKQHILRSKNASNDVDSFVRLDTTVRSFKREVPKARASGKDFKFDEKNTDPEFKYFRDVLLTQEAIDAFLRENTPEQRYEKFVNSQLGGNLKHEEERVLLQSTLDKLTKTIESYKKELVRLEKALQPTEASDKINEDIEQIRDQLLASISSIPILREPVDESQIEQFEIFYKTSLSKINLEIEELRIKEAGFNKYLSNFDSIKKLDTDILIQRQQIESLLDANRKLRDLSTKKNEEKLRLKNISSIELAIEENERFLDNSDEFIRYNTITSDVKSSKEKISEEINQLKSKEKELAIERNKYFTENNQLKKVIEGLNTDLKSSKATFESIQKSEQHIRDLELQIQNNDLKANEIVFESERLLSEINALKKFGLNPLNDIENDLVDNQIENIKKSYSQIIKTQEELGQKRKLAQGELDKLSFHQNSLAKLTNLGLEIIADKQSSECPLCEHQYDSFEALRKAVTDNSFLKETEKRLVSDINSIDSAMHDENAALNKIKLELSEHIDKKVLDKEKANDANRSALSELKESKRKLSEELFKQKNQLDLLNKKVSSQTESGYVSNLNSRIEMLEPQIKQNESKIALLSEQIKKLQDDIEKYHASILGIEEKDTPKLTKLLSDMVGYFKDLTDNVTHLKESDFVTKALVNRKEELTRSFEAERGLLVPLQKSLNEEISSYPNLDNSSIENSIELNEETIKSLQKDLETMEGTYSSFRVLDSEIDTLEQKQIQKDWEALRKSLEQSLLDTQSSKKEKQELISLIELLKIKTDVGIIYSKNQAIYNDIKILNDKVEYFGEIKTTLENDLNKINDYLKNNIENYFHTDLINTIYSKIDPHPEFKKIRFECEIKERGRPKLDVYITNNEGEIMAPNISFSSAQINVLSLSIFLAKALNTTDQSGEPVGCILIDDPIQSMDAINVLGVIDLLRNISVNLDKQIIVSTHDDNFHSLLQQKIPPKLFNSKYFELESFGKVARSKVFN